MQDDTNSLSAIDASFLHQEGPNTHMHIGGVSVLEGEPPQYLELLRHIRSRLHLVPRYRQKLAAPPFGLGRWCWVDDPSFNLEYHVRHTRLPGPGHEGRLLEFAARVFSQRLDRTKPLWELWLVEGLADGRWALISKTHHAVVDGIAGVDLMTMLFDLSREPAAPPGGRDTWQPRPEPSAAELTARALTGAFRQLAGLSLRAAAEASRPAAAAEHAREMLEGVGEIARAALTAPPETPLNVRVGSLRRLAAVHADLGELKVVKQALGGTVNDVVLAVVTGSLRRWLHSRGVRAEGMELRAGVPVSVRTADERGGAGNRLLQVLCPLPVGVPEPVDRLRFVTEHMRAVKASRQALGAELIARAEEMAPAPLLARVTRVNFWTRFYNVLVTNVPGPQVPVYALGRRVECAYPIPFLAGDRTLAVAALSYDGRMCFGLLADYDAVPDVDALADGITASIAELVEVARGGPNGPRVSRAARAGRRPQPGRIPAPD